ncbi:MAG TPA: metallophosphoesterase, partial [Promineifilum sp.]|nr:metallophosphoesterase [Promineifilum sp.]
PGRRISFGPWQSQLFALALPRAATTLAFGLLLPWLGWPVAFYANIAIQFLGYIALYRGAIVEPGRLTLTEQPITLDRLAPGSRGLRILHISDLHIERLSVREAQLLEIMRSVAADVILITGDYVNISFNVDPLTHAHVRELLGKLDAPLGVYAVPGSPAVDLPDVVPPLFEGTPVRLLRNETV